MEPLSRTERAALCNTALDAGEQAPTLCGDWNVKQLVSHLLIRERDPLAAPGVFVPQLEALTDRAMSKLEEQDFSALVERVRSGPPVWSLFKAPPLDRAFNSLEFFVHHEDIRRASPGWAPRELTDHEQRQLWRLIGYAGRGLVRPAGVPVTLRWPGAAKDGSDRTHVVRRGDGPAVVSGTPSELAMFLYSRSQHRGLSFDGPPAAVTALQQGRFEL